MTTAAGWRAGAAGAELAIPAGTAMAGYVARCGPSLGTLDPLSVGCLVLSDGRECLALIAVDLIGVDGGMAVEIAARAGLPEGAVAVCASHAHSGPGGVVKRLHPAQDEPDDPRLRAHIVEACVGAVERALATLTDATVQLGWRGVSGIAANRNDPMGAFDPTVTTLRVHSLAGDPIATVVHFACHPTILPAESRLISADFPGALRRRLPAGESGRVLFVNGAAGDISTRFTRRSQDRTEVERLGESLARTVAATEPAVDLRPLLRYRQIIHEMPTRTDAEIALAIESAARRQPESIDRVEETRRQGFALLERMASGRRDESALLTIPVWNIGELTLIGFPGELFSSLGQTLTEDGRRRLVLGYTNGYAGYFADRAAYETGTYEALASPYPPGASEDLVTHIRSRL